ncbi:hypothetical protein SAMN02745900_01173 [Pseudomonas sp. URIL14HWK12:I8]|nr:hypothetical protein SAMN02745900_01173 [Pseudomonas sp. URIL14HWK12:I8]
MTERNKERSKLNSFLADAQPQPSILISESLNFEDCIISSSKTHGSFSREWVEAEVEKSSDYFIKEVLSSI